MTEIRVRLTGPEAELGKITASDVARLLQGVERAVGRAAAGIAGRRPGLTGRRGKAVEEATRLVFDGIESGSVTALLELPDYADEDEELGLDDLSLGDAALFETMDVLESNRHNRDVADALASLAEELDIGGRFGSISIDVGKGAQATRSAILDSAKRDALRALADTDESLRRDILYGVLFEANFERRTAQLRIPTGQSVTVSFSDELADEVKEALRERTHLEGIVAYDVATSEATSVELRTVRRAEQQELGLSGGDFWQERSLTELAAEQGVELLTDPDQLRDDEASQDEVDAFFEALGR